MTMSKGDALAELQVLSLHACVDFVEYDSLDFGTKIEIRPTGNGLDGDAGPLLSADAVSHVLAF